MDNRTRGGHRTDWTATGSGEPLDVSLRWYSQLTSPHPFSHSEQTSQFNRLCKAPTLGGVSFELVKADSENFRGYFRNKL
ncbi:hypothetical protein J6590_100101 [Homalodisca vitripennis]|nr:hypothetical protein J6590_100101 [Homalodisca vitripennis]